VWTVAQGCSSPVLYGYYSLWPTFDPEREKSGQGWTETMENPPSERWQKAQSGAETAPLCAWDNLRTCRDWQGSVSSYNLIWSYPQSLWLLVFSVWTPKALQNSRSLSLHRVQVSFLFAVCIR